MSHVLACVWVLLVLLPTSSMATRFGGVAVSSDDAEHNMGRQEDSAASALGPPPPALPMPGNRAAGRANPPAKAAFLQHVLTTVEEQRPHQPLSDKRRRAATQADALPTNTTAGGCAAALADGIIRIFNTTDAGQVAAVTSAVSGFVSASQCQCNASTTQVTIAVFDMWLLPMLYSTAGRVAVQERATGFVLQVTPFPYFHTWEDMTQQLDAVAAFTGVFIDATSSPSDLQDAFVPALLLYSLTPTEPADDDANQSTPGGGLLLLPQPRVHLLMWYRTDVLEAMGVVPPATWDDLISLATTINSSIAASRSAGNGTSAWPPGSSRPLQYALCLDLGVLCKGGHILAAMLASLLQYQGTSQGFYFDPPSMRPLVNNDAMEQALSWIQQLAALSPASPCSFVNQDFLQGDCALTIDWDIVFTAFLGTAAANLRGRLGVAQLPGSRLVLRQRTSANATLEPCSNASICSTGTVESSVRAGAVTGAAAVAVADVSSSALVNRAPFSAFANFTSALTHLPDLAFSLAQLAVAEVSEYLTLQLDAYFPAVALTLASTDTSNSQGSAAGADVRPWVAAGYDEGDAVRFFVALRAAAAHSNAAPDIAVPLASYFRTALDEAVYNVTLGGEPTAAVMASLEQQYAAVQQVFHERLEASSAPLSVLYARSIGYNPASPLPPSPPPTTVPGGGANPFTSQAWFIVVMIVCGLVLLIGFALVVWLLCLRRRRFRSLLGKAVPPAIGPETTLLVTDIQSSTILWETLPTHTMDQSIKMHHECIRMCAIKRGGYESMTEGDSFILAFHTPLDATKFSLECQLDLMYLSWPCDALAHPEAQPVWVAHLNTYRRHLEVQSMSTPWNCSQAGERGMTETTEVSAAQLAGLSAVQLAGQLTRQGSSFQRTVADAAAASWEAPQDGTVQAGQAGQAGRSVDTADLTSPNGSSDKATEQAGLHGYDYYSERSSAPTASPPLGRFMTSTRRLSHSDVIYEHQEPALPVSPSLKHFEVQRSGSGARDGARGPVRDSQLHHSILSLLPFSWTSQRVRTGHALPPSKSLLRFDRGSASGSGTAGNSPHLGSAHQPLSIMTARTPDSAQAVVDFYQSNSNRSVLGPSQLAHSSGSPSLGFTTESPSIRLVSAGGSQNVLTPLSSPLVHAHSTGRTWVVPPVPPATLPKVDLAARGTNSLPDQPSMETPRIVVQMAAPATQSAGVAPVLPAAARDTPASRLEHQSASAAVAPMRRVGSGGSNSSGGGGFFGALRSFIFESDPARRSSLDSINEFDVAGSEHGEGGRGGDRSVTVASSGGHTSRAGAPSSRTSVSAKRLLSLGFTLGPPSEATSRDTWSKSDRPSAARMESLNVWAGGGGSGTDQYGDATPAAVQNGAQGAIVTGGPIAAIPEDAAAAGAEDGRRAWLSRGHGRRSADQTMQPLTEGELMAAADAMRRAHTQNLTAYSPRAGGGASSAFPAELKRSISMLFRTLSKEPSGRHASSGGDPNNPMYQYPRSASGAATDGQAPSGLQRHMSHLYNILALLSGGSENMACGSASQHLSDDLHLDGATDRSSARQRVSTAGSWNLRQYTWIQQDAQDELDDVYRTEAQAGDFLSSRANTIMTRGLTSEVRKSIEGLTSGLPTMTSNLLTLFAGGGEDLTAAPPDDGATSGTTEAAAHGNGSGGGNDDAERAEYRCLSWSECVQALWRQVAPPLPRSRTGESQQEDALLIFRGLRVRMGMHTGLSDPRDVSLNRASGRTQYGGRPLKLAREVTDATRGGMVLMTKDTYQRLPLRKLEHNSLLVYAGDHFLQESSVSAVVLYQVVAACIHPRLVYLDPVRSHALQGKDTLSAPVGYVTICFMYVVGAQILMQELGSVAQEAMEMFRDACCVLLMQVDGYLVEAADGFLLTAFHHPADALLWVLQCQQAMLKLQWPSEILAHELAEEIAMFVPASSHEAAEAGKLVFVGSANDTVGTNAASRAASMPQPSSLSVSSLAPPNAAHLSPLSLRTSPSLPASLPRPRRASRASSRLAGAGGAGAAAEGRDESTPEDSPPPASRRMRESRRQGRLPSAGQNGLAEAQQAAAIDAPLQLPPQPRRQSATHGIAHVPLVAPSTQQTASSASAMAIARTNMAPRAGRAGHSKLSRLISEDSTAGLTPDQRLARRMSAAISVISNGTVLVRKVVCRGLRLKAGCDVGLVSPEVSATTGRMVYRGRVMNRAARIACQATAGHVLTSDTAWLCAQTSHIIGAHGISASSHGVFPLKGVRERVELFDCQFIDPARHSVEDQVA